MFFRTRTSSFIPEKFPPKDVAPTEIVDHTPITVEMIHTSFDDASSKIVEDAKALLEAEVPEHHKHSEVLHDYGFVNASPVAEMKAFELKRQEAQRTVRWAERYPNYRFITAEKIQELCRKYNLVLGRANQFKDTIPMKNLREIAGFKWRDGDRPVELTYWDTRIGWRSNGVFDANDPELVQYSPSYTRKPAQFSIVAPESMFNMQGMQVNARHEIERIPSPDPIVLAPVIGGYLIVSAWGEEASDPAVINPNNN